MTTSGMKTRFGDLIGHGGRAVSRYTGTVFAVFVVQSLVALACMLAIAVVLAQAFSHLPLFDEAVDGDLVATISCIRYGRASFLAIGGIVFGALLVWQLVSWFLAGGLYGVFARRPEGRVETARCFGASGATTYLAYARLALCALPGWMLVFVVFAIGLGIAAPNFDTALTVPQLLGPIVLATLPAMLLLLYLWTVVDYARVELAVRVPRTSDEVREPGVIVTYLRTLVYVARRPLALLHNAFGYLAMGVVTLAYLYLAAGHPMYGAGGAITLFFVRQGVSLLRFAIRIGTLAGQVELGRTRPRPVRAVGGATPKRADV